MVNSDVGVNKLQVNHTYVLQGHTLSAQLITLSFYSVEGGNALVSSEQDRKDFINSHLVIRAQNTSTSGGIPICVSLYVNKMGAT